MDWYVDRSRPEAVPELRRQVSAYLERHGTDRDAAAAGTLVVGELVANALEHGDGAIWVSVDWSGHRPVVSVHDLGPEFDPTPRLAPADAEGGRGLFLVTALTGELRQAAKQAGGKVVTTTLPVDRAAETSIEPARHRFTALPDPTEATADGFDREAFLRALVVQLAQTVEAQHGPVAAEEAVAQVGTDVGGRMEEEFRAARNVVGRLSPEQAAECYVRLKRAVGGDFYVIEVTGDRIVLGNRRCPFGEVVQRAPALCRMTSSVFGGIAARNLGPARVVLEERIAVGDPGCRVVVQFGPGEQAAAPGHTYRRGEPAVL